MVTCRLKKKKCLLFLIGICFFVLVIYMAWDSEPPLTSAVGCKSKVQNMLWPNPQTQIQILNLYTDNIHNIENKYHNIMNTLTYNCDEQIKLGADDDAGWSVCRAGQFTIKEPCLSYSFGIGHDFRFEKAFEQKFKCEIHAFDPSMGIGDHQYSKRGYFHNVGLDGENGIAMNGRWRMYTLKRLMWDLGHSDRTLDFVKMDIEFSEWHALLDMVESGTIHKIRQLVIETHTPEMDLHRFPNSVCTWSSRKSLISMLHVLILIRNTGFNIYHTQPNYRTQFKSKLTSVQRYCCYNIHMVNTKHPSN